MTRPEPERMLAALERAAADLLTDAMAGSLTLEQLDRAARATMVIESQLVVEVTRRERAIEKEAALLRAADFRRRREASQA